MCLRPATTLCAGLVGGEWEGCVSPTGDHASCGSSRRSVRGRVSPTGDHALCGSSRRSVRGCVSPTGDHALCGSSRWKVYNMSDLVTMLYVRVRSVYMCVFQIIR